MTCGDGGSGKGLLMLLERKDGRMQLGWAMRGAGPS